MKKAPTLAEASPYKSVADELETLRQAFRGICQRYTERIEAEIVQLRDRVVAAGNVTLKQEKQGAEAVVNKAAAAKHGDAARNKQALALAQLHDLRDMLILLRTTQLKPAEGRRKDLKKVETLLDDLRLLTVHWG